MANLQPTRMPRSAALRAYLREARVDVCKSKAASTLVWSERYAGPPLDKRVIGRAGHRGRVFSFAEDAERAAHLQGRSNGYNPAVPLPLRHRSREAFVHFEELTERFLPLSKLIVEGNLHEVMQFWSGAELAYYSAMPPHHRSHPLLHALHHFQPDLVAFFVAAGLSPDQLGTVHPYSGDQLATEDGLTHGVSARDLWRLLWLANVIDGHSSKLPRLLREMQEFLGTGTASARDTAACKAAAAAHLTRLRGLYADPPSSPAAERALRASHYLRFFFERGALPSSGRRGIQYFSADGAFCVTQGLTGVMPVDGAANTAAGILQRLRRTQLLQTHGFDTDVEEVAPKAEAGRVVLSPARVPPALPRISVLATLKPAASIDSQLNSTVHAISTTVSAQRRSSSPTFDDDESHGTLTEVIGAREYLALPSRISCSLRRRTPRKPAAPQRLENVAARRVGWASALPLPTRDSREAGNKRGRSRTQSSAAGDALKIDSRRPRKRHLKERSPADGRGSRLSALGEATSDSETQRSGSDDRSGFGYRHRSVSASSSGSASSQSSMSSLYSQRKDKTHNHVPQRSSSKVGQSGLPPRGSVAGLRERGKRDISLRAKSSKIDMHPEYAFDMLDPAFDTDLDEDISSSDRGDGSDSTSTRSMTEVGRSPPLRLRGQLFVLGKRAGDGNVLDFAEEFHVSLPAPQSLLGRIWFEDGIPAPTPPSHSPRAHAQGKLARSSRREAGDDVFIRRSRSATNVQQTSPTSVSLPRETLMHERNYVHQGGHLSNDNEVASTESRHVGCVPLDSKRTISGGRNRLQAQKRPRNTTFARAAGSVSDLSRSPFDRQEDVQSSNAPKPGPARLREIGQSRFDSAGRRIVADPRAGVASGPASDYVSNPEEAPHERNNAQVLRRSIVQAGVFAIQRAQMRALQARIDAMSKWLELCAGQTSRGSEPAAGSRTAQDQNLQPFSAAAKPGSRRGITPLAVLMQQAPPQKRSTRMLAAASIQYSELPLGRQHAPTLRVVASPCPVVPIIETFDTFACCDGAAIAGDTMNDGSCIETTRAVDLANSPMNASDSNASLTRRLTITLPKVLASSCGQHVFGALPSLRLLDGARCKADTGRGVAAPSLLQLPWVAVIGQVESVRKPPLSPRPGDDAPLLVSGDHSTEEEQEQLESDPTVNHDFSAYLVRLELADAPEEALAHLLQYMVPLTLADLETQELHCTSGGRSGGVGGEGSDVAAGTIGNAPSCESCSVGSSVLSLLVQLLLQVTAFVRRRVASLRECSTHHHLQRSTRAGCSDAAFADDKHSDAAVRLMALLFRSASNILTSPATPGSDDASMRAAPCLCLCALPATYSAGSESLLCGQQSLVLRAHATLSLFVGLWCTEFAGFLLAAEDTTGLAHAQQCASLLVHRCMQALVDYPASFFLSPPSAAAADPLLRLGDSASCASCDFPSAWFVIAAVSGLSIIQDAAVGAHGQVSSLVGKLWQQISKLSSVPSWTQSIAAVDQNPSQPISDIFRCELLWSLLTACGDVREWCVLPRHEQWQGLDKTFRAFFSQPGIFGQDIARIVQAALSSQCVLSSHALFQEAALESVHGADVSAHVLSKRKQWHTTASVAASRLIMFRRAEGFDVSVRPAADAPDAAPGQASGERSVEAVLWWSRLQLLRLHNQLAFRGAGPVPADQALPPAAIAAWMAALSAAHLSIVAVLKPPSAAFRLKSGCLHAHLSAGPGPTLVRLRDAVPCAAVVSGLRPVETSPLSRAWLAHGSSDAGPTKDMADELLVQCPTIGLLPDWLLAATCVGRLPAGLWTIGTRAYLDWVAGSRNGVARGHGISDASSGRLGALTISGHRALEAVIGGWLFVAAGGAEIPSTTSPSASSPRAVVSLETVNASACLAVTQVIRMFEPSTTSGIIRFYATPHRTDEHAAGAQKAVQHSSVHKHRPPRSYMSTSVSDSSHCQSAAMPTYIDLPHIPASGERSVWLRLRSHPELQAHAVHAILEALTSTRSNKGQRVVSAVTQLVDVQNSDASARAIAVQAYWAAAALVLQLEQGYKGIVADTIRALFAVVAATVWDMEARAAAMHTILVRTHSSGGETGSGSLKAAAVPPAATHWARPAGFTRPAVQPPPPARTDARAAAADTWVQSGPAALEKWGAKILEQDLAVIQLIADALTVLIDLEQRALLRAQEAGGGSADNEARFSRLIWVPADCVTRRLDALGAGVDVNQKVSLGLLLRCAVDAHLQRPGDAALLPAGSSKRLKQLASHTMLSVMTLLEASLAGERTGFLRPLHSSAASMAAAMGHGRGPLHDASQVSQDSGNSDFDSAAVEEMGRLEAAAMQSVEALIAQCNGLHQLTSDIQLAPTGAAGSSSSKGAATRAPGHLIDDLFPFTALLERCLLEQVAAWTSSLRLERSPGGGAADDRAYDASDSLATFPEIPRDDVAALAAAVYGPLCPQSTAAVMRRCFLADMSTVAAPLASTIRVLAGFWWHALVDAAIVGESAHAAGVGAPRSLSSRAAAPPLRIDDRPVLVRFAMQYGPWFAGSASAAPAPGGAFTPPIWTARPFSPGASRCISLVVWPVMLAALLDRAATFPGVNVEAHMLLRMAIMAAAALQTTSADRDEAALFSRPAAEAAAIRFVQNMSLQPGLSALRGSLMAALQTSVVHSGGKLQRSLLHAWLCSSLWASGSTSSTAAALHAHIGLTRGLSWIAGAGLPPGSAGYYAQLETLQRVWLPIQAACQWTQTADFNGTFLEDLPVSSTGTGIVRELSGCNNSDSGNFEHAARAAARGCSDTAEPPALGHGTTGSTSTGMSLSASATGSGSAAAGTSIVSSSILAFPDVLRTAFWKQLQEYKRNAPMQSEVMATLREVCSELPMGVLAPGLLH